MNNADNNLGLPWHTVEKQISKEISWLKEVIDTTEEKALFSRYDDELNRTAANYYLYRLIAIMIVSGKIKAREFKSDKLWGDKSQPFPSVHRHGQEWHKNMMNKIDHYFKADGYEVIVEPNLHHGRADLGIYKEGKKDLYVEVGTTSIYKLCLNFNFMENFLLILVPSDNSIIEFEK